MLKSRGMSGDGPKLSNNPSLNSHFWSEVFWCSAQGFRSNKSVSLQGPSELAENYILYVRSVTCFANPTAKKESLAQERESTESEKGRTICYFQVTGRINQEILRLEISIYDVLRM